MASDGVIVPPSYNGDSVPLTRGMIVRQVALPTANVVVRAQADSALHAQGVTGVVLSGSAAPGSFVLVQSIGRQPVLLETGLTLTNGDTIYLSDAVPGRGTNVLPTAPSVSMPIGTLVDASQYGSASLVPVDVNAGIGAILSADISKLALVPDGASVWAAAYSDIIDFTVTGVHVVSLPKACRPVFQGGGIMITETSGVITGEATIQMGTNAPNYDDLFASQATAGFTTLPAFGQIFLTELDVGLDLSPGVFIKITSPVTGDPGIVCTARAYFVFAPLPV